jgi:hypothetical protein
VARLEDPNPGAMPLHSTPTMQVVAENRNDDTDLRNALEELVGALSEEAGLASLCSEHPEDEVLSLRLARARQLVEECLRRHSACLDRCDSSRRKIRSS